MNLKEKIKQDLKQAMKEKDSLRRDVLRSVLSGFTYELTAQGKKPTDELSEQEQLKVLKKAIKQRKEAIEKYTQGNRPELAEKESKELEILESYLPAQPNKEEIAQVAQKIKQELESQGEIKNPGVLIGQVMKHFQGSADGALVKEVVEEMFKNN